MVEYAYALKKDREDKPSFGQNGAAVLSAFLCLKLLNSSQEECGKHRINALHMLERPESASSCLQQCSDKTPGVGRVT